MSGARGPRIRIRERDLARAVARLHNRERLGYTDVPRSPMRIALEKAGYLLPISYGVWRLRPGALDDAIAAAENEAARDRAPPYTPPRRR